MRFGKEYARHQFVQVFVMDVILLASRWHGQFDPCSRKHIWIKLFLYGSPPDGLVDYQDGEPST
jgi:hypothetical protein